MGKVSYKLYYDVHCMQSVIAIEYLVEEFSRDLFLTECVTFCCRQTLTAAKTNILKMGVARVMVNVTDRESVPTGI